MYKSNGLVTPILKSHKPLLISYQDSKRDLPWVKNSRPELEKKAPQRQQFVLYYPPPKPTRNNPYVDRFPNIKSKNPMIKNNQNIHNDYYNQIVPEKDRVQIKNEDNIKDRSNSFNSQMRNREPKRNLNYGNEYSYPPVPNSFMEPPGLATSDYRLYKKAENNFMDENKKGSKNKENYYNNHKMNAEEPDLVNNDFDDKAPYIRDHAPENQSEELEESSELQEEDSKEENLAPKKISHPSEISPDGDRVEFQIQGHAGPKTYVFGFDTGDGKNRQYRLEERLKDGTVKGQYGYYDARGKLRAIKYIARPLEGYEEKHHESILPSSNSSS